MIEELFYKAKEPEQLTQDQKNNLRGLPGLRPCYLLQHKITRNKSSIEYYVTINPRRESDLTGLTQKGLNLILEVTQKSGSEEVFYICFRVNERNRTVNITHLSGGIEVPIRKHQLLTKIDLWNDCHRKIIPKLLDSYLLWWFLDKNILSKQSLFILILDLLTIEYQNLELSVDKLRKISEDYYSLLVPLLGDKYLLLKREQGYSTVRSLREFVLCFLHKDLYYG